MIEEIKENYTKEDLLNELISGRDEPNTDMIAIFKPETILNNYVPYVLILAKSKRIPFHCALHSSTISDCLHKYSLHS